MLEYLLNPDNLMKLGILIAAIAYGYSSIRSGTQKNSGEVIDIYKEQIEAQKIVIQDLQSQVNRMQQDIGKLQGLHEANEKKIKEYMDLLGPSGELKATLHELVKSTKITAKADAFIDAFPTMMKDALKDISLETKLAK